MIKEYPYTERKYEVVPYNPGWLGQFELYATEIRNIFGNLRIEHIGSTAVPDMAGKACIDVLVMSDNLQAVEDHISDMEKAGFEYAGEFVMEGSILFRFMKHNEVIANIHFFPVGHPHIKEMLDLRNYLRSHPDEMRNYSNFKIELYKK